MDHSLQVSSEIRKALKKTVLLDNGKYGYVFHEMPNKGSDPQWMCNVCQRAIVTERAMHMHLSHPLHNSKLLIPSHPSSQFTKLSPKKNDKNDIETVTDVVPGEPVPPGMEDIVEVNCQIQKAFDAYTAGPLIGLEYIVELISTEEKMEPRYICLLCEKKGDPRSVMVHVTSHNHYLKYISCFFRTAGNVLNLMARTPETKRGIAIAVNKVAAEIEKHYGRLKPTAAEMESFMSKKYEILRSIDEKQHFRETPETTFADLVTLEKIKEYNSMEGDGFSKPDNNKENTKGENLESIKPPQGEPPKSNKPGQNDKPEEKKTWNMLNPDKTTKAINIKDENSEASKKLAFKIGKPVKSLGGGNKDCDGPADGGNENTGDNKEDDSDDVILVTEVKTNEAIEVRSLSSLSSISGSPSSSRIGRRDDRSRSRERRRRESQRQRRESERRRRESDRRRREEDRRRLSRERERGRFSRERLSRERERLSRERSRERLARRRPSPRRTFRSGGAFRRSRSPPIHYRNRSRSRSPDRFGGKPRYTRYRDDRDVYDDHSRDEAIYREKERLRHSPRRDFYPSRSRENSPHRLDEFSKEHRSRREISPRSGGSETVRSTTSIRRREELLRKREDELKENKLKWSKFQEELRQLDEEMEAKFKYYQSRPEKHPLYPEVWKGFWNCRYKELQLAGKDPSKHDFKPEWIIFWEKKVKEIHEQEVADRKEELRCKLDVKDLKKDFHDDLQDVSPPTPESTKDVTVDDIKNTWKALTGSDIKAPSKRSPSPFEESRKVTPTRDDSWSNSRASQKGADKKFYEIAPPMVHCLRMLSVLENQLGSLGPKVMDLLSKALILEKSKPSHSMTLLQNRDIHILFETIKEKIRGLLLAGAVPRNLVPATRAVIKSIDNMLASNPLSREVFEPVKVPGVGMVDKVAVAQQIAAALVAQGKTDVSQQELEELINAVVGMAQASNANPTQSMSSATFFSQLDIQKSTGSSRINQILSNMITTAQKSLESKDIGQISQLPQNQEMTQPPIRTATLSYDSIPQHNDITKLSNLPTSFQVGSNLQNPTTIPSLYSAPLQAIAKSYTSVTEVDNNKSVSDAELKDRLMNFKELQREEQQSLIALLKELEKSQPERVEKLREFVAASIIQHQPAKLQITSNPPAKPQTTINHPKTLAPNSGRLSPFSSRFGNSNPTPDTKFGSSNPSPDIRIVNSNPTPDAHFRTSNLTPDKKFMTQNPVTGLSLGSKKAVPVKLVNASDDEDDDDDYSFEDVYKAASEKLMIKQQEEEEKRRKADEEKRQKELEEMKRRETERIKLQEQEEMRILQELEQKRLREEEERRRLEEEELRRREEEELRKRQAEEEAKRKEEELRRIKEEEELRRIKEEEELRRRREEEELRRRREEEELRRRYEEEEVRRRYEEEELRRRYAEEEKMKYGFPKDPMRNVGGGPFPGQFMDSSNYGRYMGSEMGRRELEDYSEPFPPDPFHPYAGPPQGPRYDGSGGDYMPQRHFDPGPYDNNFHRHPNDPGRPRLQNYLSEEEYRAHRMSSGYGAYQNYPRY